MDGSTTGRSSGIWLLPAAAWLAMALPAFFVLPAFDDWTTSVPLACDGSQALLRPLGFWRPLESLYRSALGCRPELYPQLSHLLTVLAHGVSVALVAALSRRLGGSRTVAAWAACLFAISPAVAAAVWSVDGTIQTASTAAGLASALALMSGRRQAVPAWLAWAFLAVMLKESGVAWFMLAPLIHFLAESAGRPGPRFRWEAMRPFCWGVAGLAVYAALRLGLATEAAVGLDAGRYALQFEPLRWLVHAASLIGVSLTSSNTLRWFGTPREIGGGIAGALLGLPFMAGALGLAWYRFRMTERIGWAAAVLIAAAPHLPLGQVSEMYAHPVLAVIVLALVRGIRTLPEPRSRREALALVFLIAALMTDYYKADAMIESGREARRVGKAISAQWHGERPPRSICGITSPVGPGYSVFQGDPVAASRWGKSVIADWNHDPGIRYFYGEDRDACVAAGAEAIVRFEAGRPVLR